MGEVLDDVKLRALYAWVDKIPLSRPKKNITRDFSDGLLLAEVIAAYFPALVEIHNYAPANSIKQKMYNFETLNNKVLRKLGYVLTKKNMEDMANCVPGAAEIILNGLQNRMAKYEEERASRQGGSRRGTMTPKGSASVGAMSTTTANTSALEPKPIVAETISANAATASQGKVKLPKKVEPVAKTAVDVEILREKEQQIRELQEQVVILELKVAKLEQLVRFKDSKIQKLQQMH